MSLYPYQEDGARWLAGRRRALLADGMRVGKTRQVIAAADLARAHNVLVACPGIAREGWRREFLEVSLWDRPVAVVNDASDPIEPDGVTIVSLDGSRNGDLHARIMAHRWAVLAVDEAHYLKEPASIRARQVCSASGFAARADRIWFMTGTPLLNHPGELWVMFRTIGATTDTYREFLDRYCDWWTNDHDRIVVSGLKDEAGLRALMAPHMLRRTFYELFPDKPRPEWTYREFAPLAEDLAILAEHHEDERLVRRVTNWARRVEAGENVSLEAELGKVNFARMRRATAIAKANRVIEHTRAELAADSARKVVVFAYHSELIERLAAALDADAITGKTKARDRVAMVDRFRTDSTARVLVVQDTIGRTALDLSVADTLIFAELDTVPENNAQASFRIQGPRQAGAPRVHVVTLAGTTDAVVGKIIARKSKILSRVIG